MDGESARVIGQRYYDLLRRKIYARMPHPSTFHKYSKGSMQRGFIERKTSKGWQIIISEGVTYSSFAMGFTDAGTRRTPRGKREAVNFRTIEQCLNETNNLLKASGGVKINGQPQ